MRPLLSVTSGCILIGVLMALRYEIHSSVLRALLAGLVGGTVWLIAKWTRESRNK